MRYNYCYDDFFFGKEHPIDKVSKQLFEIENSLLELGFEDEDLINKYVKAMPGNLYVKNRILREEIAFKIEADYEQIYNPNKITTVTDLADYTFCPVSYAIKQTYRIESNKNMEYGIRQHERKRLIDRFLKFDTGTDTSFYNPQTNDELSNNESFKDIFNSRLFFFGHGENDKKWFLSSKKNLVGCPDYIFEKEDGTRIVVEEKFPTTDLIKEYQTGYDSNIIQVLGYLYGIEELRLSYGYLIYWYYESVDKSLDDEEVEFYDDVEKQQPEIQYNLKYKVVKVQKDRSNKQKLIDIFYAVQKLKEKRKEVFYKNRIKPKKCVNCSVNKYCKHKTGRYTSFTLPYDDEENPV